MTHQAPSPSVYIGSYEFHTKWYPYVCPSVTKIKYAATLHEAWWVTVKSLDFCIYFRFIDPPSLLFGGDHYLRTWCTSIRHKNKIHAAKDTMRENNENLLAGAWWVI